MVNSTRYTFVVDRTSKYMNWKYCDQPYMNYQFFYIRERDILQGILVIRRGESSEPAIGVICECYLSESTQAKYTWVIQRAVNQLKDPGVAGTGIWAATADRVFEMVFRGLRFLRLWQSPKLLHVVDGFYSGEGKHMRAFIGKGDHDWDEFPNLRQPNLRQLIMLAGGRQMSEQLS